MVLSKVHHINNYCECNTTASTVTGVQYVDTAGKTLEHLVRS